MSLEVTFWQSGITMRAAEDSSHLAKTRERKSDGGSLVKRHTEESRMHQRRGERMSGKEENCGRALRRALERCSVNSITSPTQMENGGSRLPTKRSKPRYARVQKVEWAAGTSVRMGRLVVVFRAGTTGGKAARTYEGSRQACGRRKQQKECQAVFRAGDHPEQERHVRPFGWVWKLVVATERRTAIVHGENANGRRSDDSGEPKSEERRARGPGWAKIGPSPRLEQECSAERRVNEGGGEPRTPKEMFRSS
ncbi:hypothetical protein FB451DRAFT_1525724 [Mycena latifolia]|nr:hypothetical protein FB451DRAFT_1525724 [Mycena latifolia]